MYLIKLWETVENRGAWHAAVESHKVNHDLVAEQKQLKTFWEGSIILDAV